MNPALLFALWSLASGTLVSAQWFVHKTYQRALTAETQQFVSKWNNLEKTYERL